MNLTEKITLDAINKDMLYMGSLVHSLKNAEGETGIGAIFSIYPYFSLFIFESRKQLKKLNPRAYDETSFSLKASELSARSRHSLKLFEDTKGGIEVQLDYFKSIDTIHKNYFINSVRLPFAKQWKTDLSLTYYDGKLMSTSHSVTFGLGIELSDLFGKNMGDTLFSISSEYGNYLRAWGVTQSPTKSFVSKMIAAKYETKDRRSGDVYSHSFNGGTTPDYNALLMCFQSLMNSCDSLISLDTSLESSQTLFKIKYVTVYQVLKSIELLQCEKQSELTAESAKYINKLLSHPVAILILDPTKKPFRNTLIHYDVDSRINTTVLSLSKPLYGLSEAVFGIDYEKFVKQIDELVEHSALVLNDWSRL